MKHLILSPLVLCIIVFAALTVKSQPLISANAKAIINAIPSIEDCYNWIDKNYGAVPTPKVRYCLDCDEYYVLSFNDDDTCPSNMI